MWGVLVLTEARGEPLCAATDVTTVPQVVAAHECVFIAVLMFLIQLGAGLGAIALLSHGIPYLDDNVDKSNSASLIGNETQVEGYWEVQGGSKFGVDRLKHMEAHNRYTDTWAYQSKKTQ
jgi:hypothetical protein